MDLMDDRQLDIYQGWLSEFTLCRVCKNPELLTAVRFRGNPPWGFDENGKSRKGPDGGWVDEVDPADVVGACMDHLLWPEHPARPGEFIDPEEHRRSAPSNWMQRRGEEKRRARIDLIEALGGVCHVCQRERPYELVRVQVPGWSRVQSEVTSKTEWWKLIRNTPELLELTKLVCVGCALVQPSVNTNRKSTRERVIGAYGGRCSVQGCTQSEGLLVVSRPGTPALRWPNGDKYNSAAKLAYLDRNGYPDGWTLACGPHQRTVQQPG